MENKREYTDEERIVRVWDVENVKKLVYKRGYYIANEWRARELDELWVSEAEYSQTASFGRNTGWYVGMENIRRYYVEKHEADIRARQNALGRRVEGMSVEDAGLYSGFLSSHPATTGLIRLAGDGKTARGIFYSIAHETAPRADGTAEALWVPEKQAYDFVKQADGWRIWHVVHATDLVCPAGGDFSKLSPYADYDNNPVMQEFATPTIPCICHDSTFNWWDNYPPVPGEYETFSVETSYGPEGYHAPEGVYLRAGEGRNYL